MHKTRMFTQHIGPSILMVCLAAISGSHLRAQGSDGSADSLDYPSLLHRLCIATETEKQIETGLKILEEMVNDSGLASIDFDAVKDVLRCADIVLLAEPIYRRAFTSDELHDVVRFFECPEIRNRYRMRAEAGTTTFLLGNDLGPKELQSIEGCDEWISTPGMAIWLDRRKDLETAVSGMMVRKLRVAVLSGVDEGSFGYRRPRTAALTPEQIRSEAAAIAPKKYADIARCLKGSGIRDFLIVRMTEDISAWSEGAGPHPSAESIEQMHRFLGLVIKRIDEDSIVAVIAPVFDKFFTDKEMKSLADFYQTKAGKSYVQIKLRQYREPEKLSEIFLEEFNKLSLKEQDRLIAFRETEAAHKFIEQSADMSGQIYGRLWYYLESAMDEARIDLIEDADSNE